MPMTKPKKQRPTTSAAGAAAKAERQARLAVALRENLRRRKLQKRGRDEAAEDHGTQSEGHSLQRKSPHK
jgi:hypothetical protein